MIPAILVTVMEAWGSTPREAGARMLVTLDGIEGTIGGGNLEWRAIQAAREMLAEGEAGPRRTALPLGPALAQCCGGRVVLELAAADPAMRDRLAREAAAERAALPLVALFGAGHVGTALARALAPLPCRVSMLDPRSELLPAAAPLLDPRLAPDPAALVPDLPPGTFVLVVTHSHALDLEVVAAALPRADLPWVGLIGSTTKRRRFESQLRARGLPRAAIDRLVCPIGLAGITGKAPAVIAASVAAQLLIAFEARAASARLDRGAA
jgi:xanthine dehydrogenase accessory protein XdhC